MRRPLTIDIDDFIESLDRQLREQVKQTPRRPVPLTLIRIGRTLKTALQPILQSGAIVLTSFAIIFAIGAAPASMQSPAPTNAPLATPTQPQFVLDLDREIRDNLPADEFLAVAEESPSVQEADISDMPPMTME